MQITILLLPKKMIRIKGQKIHTWLSWLFNWPTEIANYTYKYTKFGQEQMNSVGFIASGSWLVYYIHFIIIWLIIFFTYQYFLLIYLSGIILVLPSISIILDLVLEKQWSFKKLLMGFGYQLVMVYKVHMYWIGCRNLYVLVFVQFSHYSEYHLNYV